MKLPISPQLYVERRCVLLDSSMRGIAAPTYPEPKLRCRSWPVRSVGDLGPFGLSHRVRKTSDATRDLLRHFEEKHGADVVGKE